MPSARSGSRRSRTTETLEAVGDHGGDEATIRWVRPAVARLQVLGYDTAPLLDRLQISEATFADTSSRVSHATLLRCWDESATLAGDSLFGLITAASLDLGLFMFLDTVSEYLLYQLTLNSDTVGDALRRYERYFPTSHDTARPRLDIGPEVVTIRYTIPGSPAASRVFTEWTLGMMAKVLADAPRARVIPKLVTFAHAAAGPADRYGRLLGGPVQFEAGENTVVVRRVDLDVAMNTAKPALIAVLEAKADAQLREREEQGLTGRVRASLQMTLSQGAASAAATAQRLGLSERTLARRLQAESTSHQELLDHVRSELARRYMVDDRLTGDQLATRLGYSELRSFQRAFKRWFGMSPAEYLNRQPDDQTKPQ